MKRFHSHVAIEDIRILRLQRETPLVSWVGVLSRCNSSKTHMPWIAYSCLRAWVARPERDTHGRQDVTHLRFARAGTSEDGQSEVSPGLLYRYVAITLSRRCSAIQAGIHLESNS